jgi:2-hydroxy-3-oxopropionate reductase
MFDPVGFIGLGLMGRPMALNLRKAGYPLIVHSRSQAPVAELVAAGATPAATPADVARQVTRIITMLPDSPDVEQILEGPDGVFSTLQRGSIVVDMSSISPAVARWLATRAAERGAAMLDAPVSGGEIGAVNGTLSIMVGGDQAAFDAVRPILDVMGNPDRVVRIGDSGAGQLCKVCNQMVIGGTLAVVSEAFALARKAGIDPALVREALLGGFASSRVLEVHGERILNSNYKPGFRAALFAKDWRIAAATLDEHRVPAVVSAAVKALVDALVESGHGEEDYSAVAKVVFEVAGLTTDDQPPATS